MAWLMTTNSFTSAVEHRDDSTKLMVRTRDFESARNLVLGLNEALGSEKYEESDVVSVPGDYKWRITVDRHDYALYAAFEIMHYVKYDNFKNAATAARGKVYHDALMRVWVAMHDLTRAEDGVNPPAHGYTGGYHSFSGDSGRGSVLEELEDLYPEEHALADELDETEDEDQLYHSLASMTDAELDEWMRKNG